ncbi:MAG: polysaccharide deacetylase family protein [Eubacteriales bacterium]|nr:polysaccharide deacetylase family protein [Eubacteriales bacterium]
MTLSYDDGVDQDERLLEIMAGFGLKGTFNLNGSLLCEVEPVYPAGQVHRRVSRSKALRLFKDSGQEVALHSATHPHLERLPVGMIAHEMMMDRLTLEGLFGCIIRGMAYPFGTYSDEVVDVLRTLGLVYARTVESSRGFVIPRDWLRLRPTCHHDDPELMALLHRFLAADTGDEPRLFYLWGHSYEFEQHGNWDVIERFAQAAGGRPDVWYATNIEVYDYVWAYRQLRFSADGLIVHNPTAVTIWLKAEGQELVLTSGETLRIDR